MDERVFAPQLRGLLMKPMKMARLSLVALLAAVISFFSLAAHAEATSQRPAVLPADVNSKGAEYARTILNKVNELRTGLGLKPVTRIAELDAVAQDWSEQMASRNSMEHRPNFTDHYPQGWKGGSENVAWRSDGGDVGALLFEQWLGSPPHYANMTDPNVDSLGIGIAYSPGNGSWYATQNFATYGDPLGAGLTESAGGAGRSGAENAENARGATSVSTTESSDSGEKRTSRGGERKPTEATASATPTKETRSAEATETSTPRKAGLPKTGDQALM